MGSLSSDLERQASEALSRALFTAHTAEQLRDRADKRDDKAAKWHAKAAGLRERAREVAALEAQNEERARAATAVPAEEEN
jgi:hypothetical protein